MTQGLEQKSWTKKEIDKTFKIIKKAKKNKHPAIKFLDKIVYWIALIVAIIGNFIISIVLIPFLFALRPFNLYLIVITIGISFGLLFELLIRSINHLKTHHHLFFGFIIPAIAIVNIFIITNISNKVKEIIPVANSQNPFVVSVVYSIAFIIPYFVYHVFLKE